MRYWLCVVVCAALIVATTEARAASAGPKIVFDQASFDFGTIYQGDEVTHAFAFRNTGDAPLKLGAIVSSCGCTAASSSGQEISPGQGGAITVTLRSELLRDRVRKHISVDSNDVGAPRVTLSLEGVIKREVDVLPFALYVPATPVGESVTREVQIRPVEAAGFHVLGAASSDPALAVSDPRPIGDEKGGYLLTVTVRAQSKPARISALVTLRTDLMHARELQIPVYARFVEQAAAPASAPH